MDSKQYLNQISEISSIKDLNQVEPKIKKEIGAMFKKMKELSGDEKVKYGEEINNLKTEVETSLRLKRSTLEEKEINEKLNYGYFDETYDAIIKDKGTLHPLTIVNRRLETLFKQMGFYVATGDYLVSDFNNFEGLNIPQDHPARDMQDTFFIDDTHVMRTHTSAMQVPLMKKFGAPLRAVVSGQCFRNEELDARHEHTFYQFEGLMVDKGLNMANLKFFLESLMKDLFGENTKIRIRPKFYPFVEPGFNIEATCFLCSGQGCNVCKKTGMLEFGGAGVIHPNVLKAGGIDPAEYTGWAFGLGPGRLAMLQYDIKDIRAFMSGDLRFLRQF